MAKLGERVRRIRRREGLTQARLAERLGISASYLNLIEHNRRPLSAPLLLKLANTLQLDLKTFAVEEDPKLTSEVLEVFADGLFDGYDFTSEDVHEFVTATPTIARSVLSLYQAYSTARDSTGRLAGQLLDSEELNILSSPRLPAEEVNELIQQNSNYFQDLEEAAESLRKGASLKELPTLYPLFSDYLKRKHDVEIRIGSVNEMRGAIRRYIPSKRLLLLSEVLRRGSWNFQIAHQICLLDQKELLKRISHDPLLTTEDSRTLCRIALANYFAAAVLMPYERFLAAAKELRYDTELLGHRFRASFEQVCHRLTTLRRSGNEGVPFHMLRVDVAGNITKRFSGSGIQFPRFSVGCARWNVHSAFLTPNRTRVQISRMNDGKVYFDVARAIPKYGAGYNSPHAYYSIGFGCEVQYAHNLVYSDGVDLKNIQTGIPIGITCRVCELTDCEQRVMPPLQQSMTINENIRGISFYGPVEDL